MTQRITIKDVEGKCKLVSRLTGLTLVYGNESVYPVPFNYNPNFWKGKDERGVTYVFSPIVYGTKREIYDALTAIERVYYRKEDARRQLEYDLENNPDSVTSILSKERIEAILGDK